MGVTPITQAQRYLGHLFGEWLHKRGFLPCNNFSFIRRLSADCCQDISFAIGEASAEHFIFRVGIGVRFESVERLLRPDREDFCSTFGCGLHLLEPSGEYLQWMVIYSSDNTTAQTDVIRLISDYGLPFLDRFSDLVRLQVKLESPDPRDWLTLAPHQRILTLAAVLFAQGQQTQASQILEKALNGGEMHLLKYRLPLVALKRRFQESERKTAI